MDSRWAELADVYPDSLALLRVHGAPQRAGSLISQMRLPLPAGESNRREEVVREKLYQSSPHNNAGKRIMDEERARVRDIQEGALRNGDAFSNFVIEHELTRPTLPEAIRNQIMGYSQGQRNTHVANFANSTLYENRQRMAHIENNYPDYDNQINNFQTTAEGFRTALREDIIEGLRIPYQPRMYATQDTNEHRVATMREGRRLLRHHLGQVEMLYHEYMDRKNFEPKTDWVLVSFRRKLLKIQEGLQHDDYVKSTDETARKVREMIKKVKAPKVTANRALRQKWIAGL